MKLNKALFYLSVLCISTTLAHYRHIPDRSNMFSEERHSDYFPSLRNLADDNDNSHSQSSSDNKIDPVTVRLKGNTELGYYYVTLFFGTPLQKQTLIVDTGSTTTTIPCSECGNDCGKHHFDRPFNHDKSESFQEFKCSESFGDYSCYDCSNKCPFSVSYVEGSSYSGHFNKDFVVFGNEIEDNFSILNKKLNAAENNTDSSTAEEHARQFVNNIVDNRKIFMPFGCTNRETKLFYDQEADGILGLGVHTNSQSSPPNLLDALHLNKSEASAAFSLCLAQDGGYFTIGGHNEAYHAPGEKIHYTRYSDAFGQYKVTINKIEVNGQNIGATMSELNTGDGAFFDSGTTLTHVPSKTYNGIRTYLHNYCQASDQNCGKGAETGKEPGKETFCWRYQSWNFASVEDFFGTFPTIKFYFGKEEKELAEYEWKPEDYLYEKDENQKIYCLGLSRYERESILGGTFMKNHDVVFDKKNRKVGFIRANCNGVQEVTAPVFVQTNRSSEVTQEPKTEEKHDQSNIVGFESHPTETHTLKSAFVMCLVGAAASIVVGLGIFVYRICRKKAPYQNMRNLHIEIPSAGLSINRLDSSNVETPKIDSQPAQENNFSARDEAGDREDQSSPEIQIEVDTM